MDDPAGRRLVVAGALRLHLARRLGPRVPADSDDDALRTAATLLSEGVGAVAGLHRVSFDPPYPGDGTVEHVRHGRRLVLRTAARADDGTALGVVLTVLVPGREPTVALAPPGVRNVGP